MSNSEQKNDNADLRVSNAVLRSKSLGRDFMAQQLEALELLKEKQRIAKAKVLEVQEKVKESNQALKIRTQGIVFHNTVNQRIDQGLVQLEKLVQQIRDAVMAREGEPTVTLDPQLHEEIEEETRNIMKSKFFKTIMKQLRREEEKDDA